MNEYILADPISIRSWISYEVYRLGRWVIRVSEKIDDWPPWEEFSEFPTEVECKDWTLPVCRVNLERTLTSHEMLGDRWRHAIALENDRLEAEAFITAREKGRDSRFPKKVKVCGDPYTGWYPQK